MSSGQKACYEEELERATQARLKRYAKATPEAIDALTWKVAGALEYLREDMTMSRRTWTHVQDIDKAYAEFQKSIKE